MIAAGWLLAALPGALGLVGPTQEVEVELPGCRPLAVLDALAPLLDPPRLAAALGGEDDAAELVAELHGLGALVEATADPSPSAISLTEALLEVLDGRRLTAGGRVAVVTADELLVLPGDLDLAGERRVLHAFVASLVPDLRQRAYCQVATDRVAAARGDSPAAAAVAVALAEYDASATGQVAAIDLRSGVGVAEPPDRVGRIGFERPHRLGPLVSVAPLVRGEQADAGMHVYIANYALTNFRFPQGLARRVGGGRAQDAELAELIARAEAAERHAAGNLAAHHVVRSSEGGLDAPAVAPDRLFHANARQRRSTLGGLTPYDLAAEHLWIQGHSTASGRCWVPADAVFFPFHDPVRGGRVLPTSSSGVAAHSTYAEARQRALCEVIERDAFMWTWVQRVERELIDDASLPPDVAERCAALRRRELDVAFVNLTLGLLPTIACVIHAPDRLGVTLACSLDPVVAARRALDEGAGLVDVVDRGRLEPVGAEEVVTPEEHAALYLDPERVRHASFLIGSDDRVAVGEVAPSDADPLEAVAARHEVVDVDLTTAASAPFHVARVVVPGLVPVSFGYDREPLGMPLLAAPRRTHDGRLLGAQLDLDETGPLDPHPFA